MQHPLNTRGLDARIAAGEIAVRLIKVQVEGDAAGEAVAELLADYTAVLRALRQLRRATARLEGSLQRHRAGTSAEVDESGDEAKSVSIGTPVRSEILTASGNEGCASPRTMRERCPSEMPS